MQRKQRRSCVRLAIGRSVQFLRVCTWRRDGRLVVIDIKEQRGRSRDDEGAELTTFFFVQRQALYCLRATFLS